jgi:uncharacterized protein
MIIDVHTHIGQEEKKVYQAGDLLKSMDEAQIAYSLIIADSEDPKEPSNIENILKQTQKNPRLKAVVDFQFSTISSSQIDKIITLLDEDKVVGVKFYIGYEHYYPYDERLFPLYKYCQKKQKPVIYHTGILQKGGDGLLKYSHPLNIDEVASLFPKMKIVMAHMGNPWLLDCAAVMAKNENVYADMSGFFDENSPINSDDRIVFKQRMLDAELFLGSYEKFLFGTDWPLYNQKEYVRAVDALDLDPYQEELVFWKNAVKVFNLKI